MLPSALYLLLGISRVYCSTLYKDHDDLFLDDYERLMKQGDVEGAILAAKRDQLKFTRIANEPLTEPTIDPRSLISLSQQRLAFLEIGISELDGGNGVPLLNPEVYRKRFTSLEKALSEYQAKKDQLIKLFEAAKENHQVQSDVNESEACIERYLAVGRRLDEIADQFHEATAQRDSLIALCSYLTTNGRDQSKCCLLYTSGESVVLHKTSKLTKMWEEFKDHNPLLKSANS